MNKMNMVYSDIDMFYTCKKFKFTLNSGVSYHIKFIQIARFILNMYTESAKLRDFVPYQSIVTHNAFCKFG